jgi:hypothetical protein
MRDAVGAVKLLITDGGLRVKMKGWRKGAGRGIGERDCGLTGRGNSVPLGERIAE